MLLRDAAPGGPSPQHRSVSYGWAGGTTGKRWQEPCPHTELQADGPTSSWKGGSLAREGTLLVGVDEGLTFDEVRQVAG